MAKPLKDALRSLVYFVPDRLASRRRQRDLAANRRHITQAELKASLDRLPIPDGSVVLLHSSLKAIGFVEGGPRAVVQALDESIVGGRNGTLLVPTYSILGTMHNTLLQGTQAGGVVFDVRTTPSNLGAIPETFRQHPGVVRSVHPTHSFGALGPLAHQLVHSHHNCGSSFGYGSPMAELLRCDSWLLGLGTNLGNVTMYHCLEDIEADFPFRVYTEDSPLTVRVRDAEGSEHMLSVMAHDREVSRTRIDGPENTAIRSFYTNWLEEHGGLTWHQVCEARSWLVSARRFYEESAKLMRAGITIYTTEEELQEQRAKL